MIQRVLLLLLAAVFISGNALADDVTVGDPADTGKCLPFGCPMDGEYQQVYSSSIFSSSVSYSVTITGIDFYNTLDRSSATSLGTGTFQISLSETSIDWNTMTGNYASNTGADNTVVFDGSIAQSWAFGDTLEIEFTTPFTYTPAAGENLLLDVKTSGARSGAQITFDANDATTNMSRLFSTEPQIGTGLVTTFEETPVSDTPEPSTGMMFFCGVALFAGVRASLIGRRYCR